MSRRLAACAALGAGLAVVGLAPPASADDLPDESEALRVTWDGPTVNLAWDGEPYTTHEASISGSPVVVPGDAQGRTVTVVNDGPGDATLRGWVTGVTLAAPAARDVHHATGAALGDFYSDLTLAWRSASQQGRASFRALAAAGDTAVVEVPLARGERTQVTIVTSLPVTATSGNRANVAAREATYRLLLRLDEGVAPAPAPTAPAGPAARAGAGSGSAAPGDGPGAGAVAVPAGDLATTGLDVLRTALVAVMGAGLGSLLVGAARRRRQVQEPGESGLAPSAG